MVFPVGAFNPVAMAQSAKMLSEGISDAVRYMGSSISKGGASAIQLLRQIPEKFGHEKREDGATRSRAEAKESIISDLGKRFGRLASVLFSSTESGSNVSTPRSTTGTSSTLPATVTIIDDRPFAEKRAHLQDQLPANVYVAPDGVISGTTYCRKLNDNPAHEFAGRTFADSIETKAKNYGEAGQTGKCRSF